MSFSLLSSPFFHFFFFISSSSFFLFFFPSSKSEEIDEESIFCDASSSTSQSSDFSGDLYTATVYGSAARGAVSTVTYTKNRDVAASDLFFVLVATVHEDTEQIRSALPSVHAAFCGLIHVAMPYGRQPCLDKEVISGVNQKKIE